MNKILILCLVACVLHAAMAAKEEHKKSNKETKHKQQANKKSQHNTKVKTTLQTKGKIGDTLSGLFGGSDEKPKASGGGQCRWVCDAGPVSGDKNVTTYPDGSWSYNMTIDGGQLLQIAYNMTNRFLVIFNPALNIAWITDGLYVGVYNIATRALFVIDTVKKLGSIFTDIDFDIALAGDLMAFFGGVFDAMVQNALNMMSNFAFNVDSFLRALSARTLEGFFKGHFNILNAFNVNFGFYINSSMKIDGLNTFLAPVVGMGKFGVEVFNFIAGSIDYGAKLTIDTIEGLFDGVVELGMRIHEMIVNGINNIINIGTGTLQSLWNLGGSFLNIFTGNLNLQNGGEFHVTFGGNAGKDGFILSYGNSSANYSFNYNSTLNTIGFINIKLGAVIVADGNTGNFILVNLQSGIGLLVKLDGSAQIITGYAEEIQLLFAGALDMPSRFAAIASILRANLNFNLNSLLAFDFKAYLSAYVSGSISADFDADLNEMITVNFGAILAAAKGNGDLYAKYGVSIIFNAVFGENSISANFGALMNLVYAKMNGQFDAKLMTKVFASLSATINKGGKGFGDFIFGGIFKACVGGGLNLFGLLGSLHLGSC